MNKITDFMELSNTQKELLGTIRRRLRKGDIQLIATKSNIRREYVGKCLTVDAPVFNENIVKAAIAILSERDVNANSQLKTLTAA